MTPRQQAIDAGRVQSADEAQSMANLMNAWGSDREFIRSLPSRKWVRGPNGWHSFDPVIRKQSERRKLQ